MNRILTSLLILTLAVACAKTEVQYEPAGEISFAPVSKPSTKAALVGTGYPADLNLYIFAKAGLPGAAVPAGFGEPYFANALFMHTSDGIFSGVPSYYWPNVKQLMLSGVSASGNVNSSTNSAASLSYKMNEYTVESDKVQKLEIEIGDYRPGNGGDNDGDNDLMWFPTTGPHGKTTEAINVEMQHACAWVTINIIGDSVTGVEDDPNTQANEATTWKVTNVKFNEISLEGDVVLGETAKWSNLNEETKTIYGTTDGHPLTLDYVDYTKIGDYNDLIVIPQPTRTLTIEYKYVSQKEGGPDGTDIVITETKDIPLKYNDADDPWQAGVHYTYNIIIGTKEILVHPTTSDWDPVTVPSVSL